MKKALVIFILTYAVVFYYVNEKYLALNTPPHNLESHNATPVINVKNVQQVLNEKTEFIQIKNSFRIKPSQLEQNILLKTTQELKY